MPKQTNGTTPEAGAAMLTLTQAAEYAGVSKTKLKSALGNKRFTSIFDPATGNVKITHFHPEIPDLIEINPAALDAWKIEREKPTTGRRNIGSDKPRRYEAKIADTQIEAARAALAPLGIDLYVAYKSRAGKARGASSDPAPVAEASPVEVGDLVSA